MNNLGAIEATVIFDDRSEYERIQVIDHLDTRTLAFDLNGAQAIISLRDPDQIQMQYIKMMLQESAVKKPDAKRALVLGLGGGLIVRWLYRNIEGIEIDAVELDPMVIKVARSYFKLPQDERIHIWLGDAGEFVRRPTNNVEYDLIYLDTYGSDSIPDHLQTEEFFTSVNRMMADGGIATMNLFKISPNSYVGNNFKAAFPNNETSEVVGGSNVIMVGIK